MRLNWHENERSTMPAEKRPVFSQADGHVVPTRHLVVERCLEGQGL